MRCKEEDVANIMTEQYPFFTIGVTTCNRKEMLKECLFSILRQTFSDFEVIVGNDYTQETLSGELVGINDPRIRFVNHPRRLGEAGNMNILLAMGCGRYFTWLADDDMYASVYLEAARAALDRFNFPTCVFTSYIQGENFLDRAKNLEGRVKVFQGRQFIYQYLSRNLRTIGNYAIFDINYLKQIGGIETLGNGLGPYCDNLLAIKTGLLKKIIYIDAPLVFFRTHEQSLSWTSPDVDAYTSAQRDLLDKSIKVFMDETLVDNLHYNLFLLLKWCITDFVTVARRSRTITLKQLITYLILLKRYMHFLKGTTLYWRAAEFIIKTMLKSISAIGKARIRILLQRK